MKKWLCSIVAAALIVSATAAIGAVKEEQFSLSPVIGGYTFEGTQHLKTNLVYGVRAGYNITSSFGIEGLFDYVNTKYNNGIKGDVSMYRYGADMLYHFWPDNNLVPYVAAGFAGISFDGNGNSSKSKSSFDYGLGAKYFINDIFALRGDVRHIIYSYNKTYNNVEYTLGAHFPFGGVKPVVKPVEPVQEVIEQPKAPPAPVVAPVVKETKPAPVVAPPQQTEAAKRFCDKPAVIDVLFDFDKSVIKTGFLDDLKKLGAFMKEFPEAKGELSGHTDSIGTKAYNKKLSQRRADAVKKYLVDTFGIDKNRLTTMGYGEDKPVASNKTKEGRAKNRRTETNLTCK